MTSKIQLWVSCIMLARRVGIRSWRRRWTFSKILLNLSTRFPRCGGTESHPFSMLFYFSLVHHRTSRVSGSPALPSYPCRVHRRHWTAESLGGGGSEHLPSWFKLLSCPQQNLAGKIAEVFSVSLCCAICSLGLASRGFRFLKSDLSHLLDSRSLFTPCGHSAIVLAAGEPRRGRPSS